MQYQSTFESPIGPITLIQTEESITRLWIHQKNPDQDIFLSNESPVVITPLLFQTKTQILEYFEGKRREFTIPFSPKGTPFQERCWKALLEIPYAKTCSYKDLATTIGNPKACRAVGNANHNNPIPIIIPCHRVIGANGSLVGYGGGLPIKKYLLELEANYLARNVQLKY